MNKWMNVTDTFSEEQRHYRNTYLEICEVMDDNIEVSFFSCENEPCEIYVSFGIMYGISYVEKSEAEKIRRQMKEEIEAEYSKNGEPSRNFINEFAKKYSLTIQNSLFDESALLESLGLM